MLGMAELSTSPCLLLSAARHSINPITITHQPRLATKHGDNIHLGLITVAGEGPYQSLLLVGSNYYILALSQLQITNHKSQTINYEL